MSAQTRIGDAERDAAAAALGDHYAAGRLDHDEYSERLDAAWSARTRADLDLLFHDLPPLAPPPPPVSRRSRRLPLPVAAILVLLAGAFVITHLPVILLVLGIVLLVKLVGRGGHHGHHGHRGHPGHPGHPGRHGGFPGGYAGPHGAVRRF